MLWEILFILVLIFLNGLFAAAETSLIAARKGRLEQRAAEGNRNAKRALDLARNPDLFLPTAQIGITLVSALGAAYGGHEIVHQIQRVVCRVVVAHRGAPCRRLRSSHIRGVLHLRVADPR